MNNSKKDVTLYIFTTKLRIYFYLALMKQKKIVSLQKDKMKWILRVLNLS